MLGLVVATNTGCILPIYNGDPAKRTQQLMYTSENLRMMQEEWERFWHVDQPSHLSPIRTHGGIL
jgi:hypothetical protein